MNNAEHSREPRPTFEGAMNVLNRVSQARSMALNCHLVAQDRVVDSQVMMQDVIEKEPLIQSMLKSYSRKAEAALAHSTDTYFREVIAGMPTNDPESVGLSAVGAVAHWSIDERINGWTLINPKSAVEQVISSGDAAKLLKLHQLSAAVEGQRPPVMFINLENGSYTTTTVPNAEVAYTAPNALAFPEAGKLRIPRYVAKAGEIALARQLDLDTIVQFRSGATKDGLDMRRELEERSFPAICSPYGSDASSVTPLLRLRNTDIVSDELGVSLAEPRLDSKAAHILLVGSRTLAAFGMTMLIQNGQQENRDEVLSESEVAVQRVLSADVFSPTERRADMLKLIAHSIVSSGLDMTAWIYALQDSNEKRIDYRLMWPSIETYINTEATTVAHRSLSRISDEVNQKRSATRNVKNWERHMKCELYPKINELYRKISLAAHVIGRQPRDILNPEAVKSMLTRSIGRSGSFGPPINDEGLTGLITTTRAFAERLSALPKKAE